jgi:hypothetical protein
MYCVMDVQRVITRIIEAPRGDFLSSSVSAG